MNRRQLLKLLVSGVVGHTLDVDRLLWIPNRIKYFLPSDVSWIHKPSIAEIIAVEQLRLIPNIKALFERDDLFYKSIERRPTLSANRVMRIPLIIEPGNIDWGKS